MFPLSAPVQTLHTQLSLQTKEQFEPLKSLQMMFQKKKKKASDLINTLTGST